MNPALELAGAVGLDLAPNPVSRDIEKLTLGDEAIDPNLVIFAEPFDADNPLHWKDSTKWMVTSVMSATAFLRITSSTIMAPALTTIARDFHMTSLESQMALSIFLLASAFGPLVLSPFSEMYGRQPVLHVSNVFFLVWNMACGFSNTSGLLITSRCFAGLGGSVAYALGNAVLGDIWQPEERGKSLGVFWIVPLLGAAIGPTIGGYISQYASWHWVFWSLSIAQAVLILLSFFMLRESHAATILKRRAKHCRKITGNPALFTVAERLDVGKCMSDRLLRSLSRPIRLLAFHPIVQIVGALQAFSYGVLYLVLTTYATLWIDHYGESVATSGLHYFAYAIGEASAAELGGPLMDYVYRKLKTRNSGRFSPEYRLPLILPGVILAPIGLFIYGWTANAHAPWPAVDAGVMVLAFGLQLQGQPLAAYIIDAYPDHVSSATAASQLLRSLAAFGFPLFAPNMYAALGYGWGNSTLAFVSIALFTPGPALLWFYGPKLRSMAQSSY